jgi:hypothetical protein
MLGHAPPRATIVSELGVDEKLQDVADCPFSTYRVVQRKVGLDAVTITAAFFVFDHITRLRQVHNDAVGSALGDVDGGGQVSQSGFGLLGDEEQGPGVVCQEAPFPHFEILQAIY